jgi:O-antigen/teichoic acid export membrane protein
MQRLGFTVFRNAVANVIRGGASAIVALALPHFLVHALIPARFNAWSLILQVAAYASYFDFGLQLAVSRFLAQAIELDQRERLERLISTALSMLSGAGAVALLIMGVVIALMPWIFHGIPAALMSEVRLSALILGGSAALLLPASVYTGVLIGLHRNDVPALVIGTSRLVGAATAIFVARYTQSLVALAASIAIANLIAGLLQWQLAGRFLPGATRLGMQFHRQMAKELLHYCAGLTVFSVGMFLVSGLDVTILGHFDFSAVGFYSIASLMVTFVAGLNSSMLTALMTPLAALQAQRATDRIRAIVLTSTRAHIGLNLLGTGVLFCFGPFLLRLWVGQHYAVLAYPIMQVLMLAQLLRLIPSAYCTMLIATGQQQNAIGNSIIEAIVNVIASVLGAMYFGAIGVAYGTLIGAVVALFWVKLWTIKRDRVITITPHESSVTVMIPFACCAPIVLVWLATHYLSHDRAGMAVAAQSAALLLSAFLLLHFGDLLPERLRNRLRMRWMPSRFS